MQNLYEELKTLLSDQPQYIKDGKPFKNKIVEDALRLDATLIRTLLTHDKLKKHFFQDVDGTLIFDKIKFQRFVQNKQFLPDSYTQYKNKIGLTADGEYLTESREVVLSWAYKDCVLEGGQTKEEQKRKEIFWNETLAPDEIDRLFEPKALTNWKKYNQDGEHPVTEPTMHDNLIIKGNNLLALHSLKKVYAGKVKLIYIDPPYNTGDDEFKYNDSFNHSAWLTFIKNRIEIAYQLLSNDGFLFVQINDIEVSHLKVLIDSIFHRENFLTSICVKMSHLSGTKMAHKEKKIPKIKEHILMFAKNKNNVKLTPQYIPCSWNDAFDRYSSFVVRSNYGEDECQNWEIITVNEAFKRNKIDKKNPKAVDDFLINNAHSIFRTARNRSADYSNLPRDTFTKYVKDSQNPENYHFVYKGEDVSFAISKIRDFNGHKLPSTILGDIWTDIGINNLSNEGGVSLRFGKKPEKLIARIVQLTTNENDIVLDFFAGSGTTAAVAHKLGRQYITIEQMDYVETITKERLKKVIGEKVPLEKGETIQTELNLVGENGSEYHKTEYDKGGISKSVNWQGGGSFVYAELMQDNQRFIDAIAQADTTEQLKTIWQDIQENGFISYLINPKQIDKEAADFEVLSLEHQKQFLVEILDKNLLYVNYHDLENGDYQISDTDKALNRKFYNLK